MKKIWRITWISFVVFYLLAFTAQILSAATIPLKKPFRDYSTHKIMSYVKKNEGYSIRVYEDTRGHLTVGYGHKLPKEGKYQLGNFVSVERIDRWFRADFNDALRCSRRFLNNDYNEKELTVITDMAFQLGCNGIHKFWRLRKHINNKDYTMAVKAIRGSLYYNQTKNRALRNIKLLTNGER